MTGVLAAGEPVVDWNALGQVIAYSLVAGVGVTLCYALAILGAARFNERRVGGRGASAAGYAALMIVGLAATLAAVIAAIIVMTNKG